MHTNRISPARKILAWLTANPQDRNNVMDAIVQLVEEGSSKAKKAAADQAFKDAMRGDVMGAAGIPGGTVEISGYYDPTATTGPGAVLFAALTGAAAWQRCYVHFLRNALDYLPRKQTDDCLTELRWLYDRHTAEEARRDLAQWLARWQDKHPKLCAWVEANIDETFAFYRLPREHHKHLKSTNMLERLNQEIKRRTLLVRIFPDEASCLRLVRALAVEIHHDNFYFL